MTTALAEKRIVTLAGSVLKGAGSKGPLQAVVNTGFLDLQGDVMAVGCWRKVVQEQQQPLLFWNHDYSNLPLGSASALEELRPGDPRIPAVGGKSSSNVGALLARLNFADTTAGRDARTLAAEGHIREFSVVVTNKKEDEETSRDGVRTVRLVHEIPELSLVIRGASLGTHLVSASAKAAYGRLQSATPAWMRSLIKDVAETAEDATYLLLQEAESRNWYAGRRRAAVAAGLEAAKATIRREIERQRELAAIEKAAGVAGNYWKVQPRPTPRPPTERQKFEREIAWRAGIVVG